MDEKKRYNFSFDLDGILGLLNKIIDYFLAVFRPVAHFITNIAGQSWAGFAIVFMIFFMVFLVRIGAKTGKSQVYGSAMEYIGFRGMSAGIGYLFALALEFIFMPALVMLVAALVNTVTSGEPGIGGALQLLFSGSPARGAFLSDLGEFYGSDRLLLPLGFRSTGLIAAAFFCMWVVGKALNWRKDHGPANAGDSW